MGRRGHHTYKQLHSMIVDAAFELMQTDGYTNISTRKIAKKIGYTVGTLYIIFQNLEEIFLHVNGKTLTQLNDRMLNALDGADPANILSILAENYLKFATEHYNLWALLFEYNFNNEIEMPKWYIQKIQNFDSLIFNQLKKVFPKKLEDDLKATMALFWSSIHGIIVLDIRNKLVRAGQTSANSLISKVINILMATT